MLLESATVFGEQVGGYRSELFAHCYRMLGTVDEAEDVLQESLMRAWQGRQTYREEISFRGELPCERLSDRHSPRMMDSTWWPGFPVE
jgi:sigma-70-like protein